MASWSTVIEMLLIIIGTVALCSGSNFLGPRNITRGEGTEQEIIPCRTHQIQATPYWKINSTIYYYSNLPPPFGGSKSGREIIIPVVDSTLNGTSFQCFTPSSSGADLISSSIGVLTVMITGIGHLQVPSNKNNPQSKLVLIHQNLAFSPSALKISWRALSDSRCGHYQLVTSQSCDVNRDTMVLINRTKEETIVLEHGILSNFTYFNLTAYDEDQQCEELFLESFQFMPETITEIVQLCLTNVSDSCSHTSTCTDIPPLNRGQTLILALPFLPATTGLEDDLLCPIHPLPDERCVDLLSCNRFRKSAYANTITICRIRNSDSSLEMCFHNITDIMNETRLHFFYSDLHCRPNGNQHESTRLYTKSIQVHVTKIEDTPSVAINDSTFCITFECPRQDCTITMSFKISTVDKFSCTFNSSQSIMVGGCVSFATLQMKTTCAPYYVTIEAYNKTIFNGSITEIQGYASDSECTCYGSQSTKGTQSLAVGVCAIFGLIILTLLIFIAAVTYKNYKMLLT